MEQLQKMAMTTAEAMILYVLLSCRSNSSLNIQIFKIAHGDDDGLLLPFKENIIATVHTFALVKRELNARRALRVAPKLPKGVVEYRIEI